jgi:hypothetical protein
MKRQPFLTVPSMPTSTVGAGIIPCSIDARLIDPARFMF